jgi:ABC-type multidrug transport system fused ATPase/permease subunit
VDRLKAFIKKYFTHFSYFYTHLRHRLFIALLFSLVVAILDGFGLAMFLPLLQVADGGSSVDAEALGGLRFLIHSLQGMGITLSLTTVLLVILVFFSLKGIAKFVESYYKVIVRQHFVKKMRFDNVNMLANMQYKGFVLSDSGRIQNTLSGEVARVAQAYQHYMTTMQDVVMVLVYVALAILSNPGFALLVVGGGLLSNLLYKQVYSKTKAASKKMTHDGHIFQGLLIQQVAFFKYLKATGLIRNFAGRLKEYIVKIERSNKRIGFYASILNATREPLVVLVVVSVIIIQVTYFTKGIGLIMISLMFFYRSLTYLMNMQNYWNNFLANSGSLENMTAFMKEMNASQEKYGRIRLEYFRESIEFQSVTFGYSPPKKVLNNINLRIQKNETIAFVGESGSGKTTLVNVAAGLLPVQDGQVLIDGQPMTQLFTPSWQQRIGYITQEPVIFSDTVFNNITFWAEPSLENMKRFWTALEKAAIAGFVRQMPKQENTQLGASGVLVSGGQKQRLSIARELYKNVDILIMDEATSALDSETELAIQENIESLKGQYTILIIAHRLATVKSADRIVLMNQGAIAAEGVFEKLLNESTSFNKMVSLQEL